MQIFNKTNIRLVFRKHNLLSLYSRLELISLMEFLQDMGILQIFGQISVLRSEGSYPKITIPRSQTLKLFFIAVDRSCAVWGLVRIFTESTPIVTKNDDVNTIVKTYPQHQL